MSKRHDYIIQVLDVEVNHHNRSLTSRRILEKKKPNVPILIADIKTEKPLKSNNDISDQSEIQLTVHILSS